MRGTSRLCWKDKKLLIFRIFLVFAAAQRSFCSEISDEPTMPRGVYHYSDNDQQIESSFKVLDLEALDPIKMASDLMASAVKVDTKRKSLSGIEVPFSLTGRPMSIQINGEAHNAVSLADSDRKTTEAPRRSDMSPESRQAFLKARQICLEQSAASCDEALDTFHRLRFGKSLMITENDDEKEENDEYMKIIEQRLKAIDKDKENSNKNTRFAEAATSDPFESEDEEEEEEEEEEEPIEDDENDHDQTTHISQHSHRHSTPFARINYHDKARHFLHQIN